MLIPPLLSYKADCVRRSPTIDSSNTIFYNVNFRDANPDFAKATSGEGGEGEIRTRGDIAATVVFKTTALVHYATSPVRVIVAKKMDRSEY